MRAIYGALRLPVLVAVLVVSLAGCSLMPTGSDPPPSFNQRVGDGYLIVSAVRDTALRLLEGGKISDQDAQTAQDEANNMRAMLDGAREIQAVSESSGESRLQSTLTYAQAVTDCLAERERGPPEGEVLPSLAVCIQSKAQRPEA